MNNNQDTTCRWCGGWLDPEEAEDRARWLGGDFCSDDCAYADARDGNFVSDAEHEANVAEGWIAEGAL
ncbi:Uncharacterised protein [Mycobacteroides abscessus subsp. massiliense]|uniref:hypothetical protein n=1 Tax=Mycobacteroides TaxID=670516 RepID=UPI0009269C41|nr:MULTISPECIES: hypothetical protein [Mycobacteroides]MBV0918041.1 hypothetical protein [Mycobacteroides chelonae]RIT59379.1 hypothetical protein D2E95_09315 [Mycobacteroides abscessus]SHX53942.1 Uncharacterised protein [Mycobacteroides abscessus subsp. abscessus]SKM75900.1 Uncharacterised protein [Mycobacteroides abscessus subsp. massiliense]SKM76921.1 Uncharacterised protein [Mycobacteroides abscessus subsp. massiliense]